MDTAPTKRLLRILYFAMFCAIGLYWFVMEMIQVEPADVRGVKTTLLVIAGGTAVAVLYMRLSRIPKLLSRFAVNPNQQIVRLRMHYILCYALSISVALYGFILHFLGSSRAETVPFLVGAIVLFLFCYSRVPETVGHSHERASEENKGNQVKDKRKNTEIEGVLFVVGILLGMRVGAELGPKIIAASDSGSAAVATVVGSAIGAALGVMAGHLLGKALSKLRSG